MGRPAVAALLGLALAACGSSSDGAGRLDEADRDDPQLVRGAELFARNCSGCHTLAAAGARGSAEDPDARERRDGPNLEHRQVSYDDALFAIRNGGFSRELMPARIVTGNDAEDVARFVARYAGRQGPAGAATPSATISPFVRTTVERMPTVTAGSARGALPEPSSASIGDPTVQRAAFDSAQAMWRDEFEAADLPYDDAHLIVFHTLVHTPCGVHDASTGPFYCPTNLGVYLNPDFFDALARAYGLRTPFAAAYVTAHEVGHHVQQVLGLHARIAQANQQDPDGANGRSVLVELQADCYAGVWLHTLAREGELTQDDLEDILRAAAIVGDDFRRARVGAELAPETWTHGSSEQRVHWLSVGVASGSPPDCDTFTGAG